MGELSVEMMTPEKVEAEWGVIGPMLAPATVSNPISAQTVSVDDIRKLAIMGMCVLFMGREAGKPRLVVALQFNTTNGHKGADIISMGGSKLLKFKAAYWDLIIDWLKANECEYLDAHADERMAKIYASKFGFSESCVLVRKAL